MLGIYLVEPTLAWEAEALAYRASFLEAGEEHINGSLGFSHYSDYAQWLEKVKLAHHRETSLIGVAASTYFCVRASDQTIIGTIQLRHELNEEFSKRGGHIGYGIKPKERGKGYGAEQLRLVLEKAKEMGLTRVMISCDQDNFASSKVALKNHAKLEWEGYDEEDGWILIYWITL